MSTRKIATLGTAVLLLAVWANAASRNNEIRIKVIDSETHSVNLGGGDVPKNCDGVNFDAYCNNSTTTRVINTLLVQEGNEPPFRITCTIESKYSRCTPLPKGESFDARREKKGITVYYVDDKGKPRKQFYTLVAGDAKAGPTVTAAAVAQAVPAGTAPPPSSPPPPPVPGHVDLNGYFPEKVKCNFSSTPPGAEITVDWRYVGNTPSEIGLVPGTHVVVISLPGFAEWKRELTVGADSAVNVTANLQKTQP